MPASQTSRDTRIWAHVLPFAVFMSFSVLLQILESTGFTIVQADQPWYRRVPEQWVYPLQTLVTLAVLFVFRRQYEFRPVRGLPLAVLAGSLGIAIWILPGCLFRALDMQSDSLSFLGFAARVDGFNPMFIREENAGLFGLTVGMRFLRLVLVVPVAEEIFWRSFLMRYVDDLDSDYWKIPFGTFRWRSFLIVTAAFTLVHQPVDYTAAAIYGTLAYAVAVRTKSLTACIVMHAVANLVLGIYTMWSGQWGYW